MFLGGENYNIISQYNMKKNNILRIIITVLLTIISIFMAYTIITSSSSYETYDATNINEDVIFKYNNEDEKKIKLDEFLFPKGKKGDTLILSKILEEDNIKNPTLVFETYHSIIEVYIDGEKIYEYGKDLFEENILLGHGYFHIPMPADYRGKDLMIKAILTEDNPYRSFTEIKVINEGNSYLSLIKENKVVLAVSLSIILIGGITLIISLTRKSYGIEYSNITFISIFCVDIGIWMICNNKIAFLFINNFEVVSLIAYFSLYIMPIPISIYFARMQTDKRKQKILNIYGGICSIFCLYQGLLFMFSKKHYNEGLFFSYILIAIGLIIIVYCSINGYKKKEKAERILINGMLFMLVLIASKIIIDNISRHVLVNSFIKSSLLPIGTLIFIISMVYSYSLVLIESYYGKKEREILEDLAYNDGLTGINNRAKCQEIMRKRDTVYEEVTIVSFDINDLKYVNDSLGHQIGDKMIINVATLIKEAFGDIGQVGRMGGDEFIAIIDSEDQALVKGAMNDFYKLVDKFNSKDEQIYNISVSVGYSIRKKGQEISVYKIYEKSDEMMYKCKKKQKENTKLSNKTKNTV